MLQQTPPVKEDQLVELLSNHPFPMWNNQRTPESLALLGTKYIKTKVNPTEGMKEALL